MKPTRCALMLSVAIVLTACGAAPPGGTASLASSPAAASTASETAAPTATSAPTPTPFVYPMRLEEIGHMGGDATALAVIGSRAYLQLGDAHFMVVDISDPHKPAPIGPTHRVPGGISQIAPDGDHLAVMDQNNKVLIYDVTDDLNPRVIQKDASAAPFAIVAGLPDEALSQQYRFSYREEHFDDPLNQQILVVCPLPNCDNGQQIGQAIGPLADGDGATTSRMVVRGSFVYLADNDTFRIYDIAHAPRIVDRSSEAMSNNTWWPIAGSLSMDAGTRPGGGGMYFEPQTFCMAGDHLLTGSGYWDLTDPAAPRLLGKTIPGSPRCDTDASGDAHFSQPYGRIRLQLNPDDRTSVVAGSGVLRYTDSNKRVSDVFFTRDVGEFVANGRGRLYYLALDDPAKPAHSFLEVFDTTDPYHPKLLGKAADPQPPFRDQDSARLIGEYLIWEHYDENQVSITLDATDPAHITTGSGDSDSYVVDPETTITGGDYVYHSSTRAISIYQADHLQTALATLDLPPHAELPTYYGPALQLFGNMLFDEGQIIDVSDPAHPRLVALAESTPYAIEMHGDAIYFNLLNDGFSIYRLVPN